MAYNLILFITDWFEVNAKKEAPLKLKNFLYFKIMFQKMRKEKILKAEIFYN